MPETNLEIVRRWYQGDNLMPLEVTPDVEYINPPEAIEPGVRRGRVEVAQALQSLSESFDTTRYELHKLFEARDTVVASVSFYARGRGSETEVVQEEVHTWTLRDGRVARFEWGRDLRAALEAAGLSE